MNGNHTDDTETESKDDNGHDDYAMALRLEEREQFGNRDWRIAQQLQRLEYRGAQRNDVPEQKYDPLVGNNNSNGNSGHQNVDGNVPWRRLPTSTLSESDVAIRRKSESTKTCQICKVDFAVNDTTRRLPCVHEFHMECIDQWFRLEHGKGKACSCPTDRKRIDRN